MSFILKQFSKGKDIASKALAYAGDQIERHPYRYTAVGLAGAGGTAAGWDAIVSRLNGSPAADAAMETLKGVWAPAAAAAILSGGAGGMMASRIHNPGETKEERRRRILNSALVTGGMGGTAVAALPTAYSVLATPATIRDKYGSQSAINSGVSGAIALGKYGAGALLGIGAVRYAGKYGLAHKNRVFRDMASRHVNLRLSNIAGEGGTVATAAERALANLGAIRSREDKNLLKFFAHSAPALAAKARTGEKLTFSELTDMRALSTGRNRGKLSDAARLQLAQEYGVDSMPALSPEFVEDLALRAQQAGRLDFQGAATAAARPNFLTPKNRKDILNSVPDLEDPTKFIRTPSEKVQLAAYLGAGLLGHIGYHSVVPSL